MKNFSILVGSWEKKLLYIEKWRFRYPSYVINRTFQFKLKIFKDWYIKTVSEPTSSIKSFNTEVTTEPCKRGGCSAWLAEASYADETFVR